MNIYIQCIIECILNIEYIINIFIEYWYFIQLANHLTLSQCLLHSCLISLISPLPHLANMKFLTMAQVFYFPITSLATSPTILPLTGFVQMIFGLELLLCNSFFLKFLFRQRHGSSLTSFQFLLKSQFLRDLAYISWTCTLYIHTS